MSPTPRIIKSRSMTVCQNCLSSEGVTQTTDSYRNVSFIDTLCSRCLSKQTTIRVHGEDSKILTLVFIRTTVSRPDIATRDQNGYDANGRLQGEPEP